MTMPNIDNIMPYGMVWKPRSGTPYFTAASSSSRVDGPFLRIDPAPVQVTFSWDGAEACSLYLRRAGQLYELSVIPAKSGGGTRPAQSVKFGALYGDQVYLYLRPNHAGDGDPTGTIEVVPTYLA